MEIFEEQSVLDLYKTRFGNEGMKRFRQITDKVKAGHMTYRQAASTLGVTYYEFVSLLDETDAAD
jgi:hypothetical protein